MPAELQVVNGAVMPDLSRDNSQTGGGRAAWEERQYRRHVRAWLWIAKWALASSVAHDHHNIIVTGTNDADMAACVQVIEEMQGGLAIASGGQVLGKLRCLSRA